MEAGTVEGVVPANAVDSIHFTFNSLPGSMNQLFEYNRHDSGLPVRRLRAEWAMWKSNAKVYVPLCIWARDCLFKVEMEFESPSWVCKNGNLRRRDLDNLEKLILDTIFEKLGRDDSRVAMKVSRKVMGTEDRVHVTLSKIAESEWKGWVANEQPI